jgi:hypothetical protein
MRSLVEREHSGNFRRAMGFAETVAPIKALPVVCFRPPMIAHSTSPAAATMAKARYNAIRIFNAPSRQNPGQRSLMQH